MKEELQLEEMQKLIIDTPVAERQKMLDTCALIGLDAETYRV